MAACHEIQNELSAYLDHEMPAEQCAQVDEHLRVCPCCQAVLSELRRIQNSLAALPKVAAPQDLAAWIKQNRRLESRLDGAAPVIQASARSSSRFMTGLFSLAALLLLAVLLFGVLPQIAGDRNAPVASRTPNEPRNAPAQKSKKRACESLPPPAGVQPAPAVAALLEPQAVLPLQKQAPGAAASAPPKADGMAAPAAPGADGDTPRPAATPATARSEPAKPAGFNAKAADTADAETGGRSKLLAAASPAPAAPAPAASADVGSRDKNGLARGGEKKEKLSIPRSAVLTLRTRNSALAIEEIKRLAETAGARFEMAGDEGRTIRMGARAESKETQAGTAADLPSAGRVCTLSIPAGRYESLRAQIARLDDRPPLKRSRAAAAPVPAEPPAASANKPASPAPENKAPPAANASAASSEQKPMAKDARMHPEAEKQPEQNERSQAAKDEAAGAAGEDELTLEIRIVGEPTR